MPSGEWSGGERPRQPRPRALVVSSCKFRRLLRLNARRYAYRFRRPCLRASTRTAAWHRSRRSSCDVERLLSCSPRSPASPSRICGSAIVDEYVEAPHLCAAPLTKFEAAASGHNVSLREGEPWRRRSLISAATSCRARRARSQNAASRRSGDETPLRRLADPRCPVPSPLQPCVVASPCSPPSLHANAHRTNAVPSDGHRLLARPGCPTLQTAELRASASGTLFDG